MGAGADSSDSKKRKRERSSGDGNTNTTNPGDMKYKAPQTKKAKTAAAKNLGVEQKKMVKAPKSAKERRLAAKEKAEARKKRKKPNYIMEKELAILWEKIRRHDVSKEERSKLASEAIDQMNGKFLEIAGSHVSARVLQTCLQFCSAKERDIIFDAFRPHLFTLARKRYAVHLVKKLLDTASKKEVDWFFSSLHGQVASLLQHSVGASVVEHAFRLARGSQKQSLLIELYSKELQLFKDLTAAHSGKDLSDMNSSSLACIISKIGLQKSSVLQYMSSVLKPILEKGIVDYSIVHKAIHDYFTIADKSSAADVVQQLIQLFTQNAADIGDNGPSSISELPRKLKGKKRLSSEPLLVRMTRSREGLKLGIACIRHGTAKERKRMVKTLKGHVRKLALHHYGSLLLICVLSVVDDTRLVKKVVIAEIKKVLKELVMEKHGRSPLLQLLHPQSSGYLNAEDLACLNFNIPSLSSQNEDAVDLASSENSLDNERQFESLSLKDSDVRRKELLLESGLAESLLETCIANVSEILRSQFGKDILYEVAVAGDGILKPLDDEVKALHAAIVSESSLLNTEDPEKEHVFHHFHSSRIIRKLILGCPSFAVMLWECSLQGKCEIWARGHSAKVVAAYLKTSDPSVGDLAKHELQPLVDNGTLKVPNS